MKSLKPRLLTAVIGIPFLLLVLFVVSRWPVVLTFIVGAATAFMVGEYLHAAALLKRYGLSISCMLFGALMPVLINTEYVYILLFVFMIVGFSVIIKNHRTLTYANLSYALFGTLVISFGTSAISVACKDIKTVIFYFVLVFLLPWMADAGGFFVGAAIGKHKLCPNISPKKTVEGVIGGVLFCGISAVGMGLIFQNLILPELKVNFIALLILAAIVSVLSILGDLSFSLIKRSLNIKDYGSIFPGHGGMLDRFDSIIFTAPAIIAIDQFVPFIS